MNAVLMVIGHVFANEPPQVALTERNDMVEKLSPAASDPPLGDSILPGRLNARALGLQPGAFQNVMTSASNFESRSRMT